MPKYMRTMAVAGQANELATKLARYPPWFERNRSGMRTSTSLPTSSPRG